METGLSKIGIKSLYKGRKYHNWTHVESCLGYFNRRLSEFATEELLFAIVYHDSIYNPESKTNEEDSVSVAKTDLSGLGLDLNKIETYILATKHTGEIYQDDATQCMLDVDLSILGASPELYKNYSDAIRQEYSFVSDKDYFIGRKSFLEKMLVREKLFYKLTEFEASARLNLKNEIVYLSGKL
jgi:predicted metal-dependent HD superfamily phosphohydrolase